MDSSLFSELLQSFSQNNSFKLHLVDLSGCIEEVQCAPLNLAQLKQILSCAKDPTPVNAHFNRAIIKFINTNVITGLNRNLTVLDKLCFVLQTRINSISSTATYSYKNEPFNVDLNLLSKEVIKKLQSNSSLFKSQLVQDEAISVKYGLPLLETEKLIFEEIYTDSYFDQPEETLIGNLISNEVCSCIYSVTINDKTIDLSELTFSQRIALVELLPANLTISIINYLKKLKELFEDCMKVDGVSVPLDHTLFLLD